MKNLIGLIVLALACVGLGIALLVSRDNATKQQLADESKVAYHSNEWWTTHEQLEEQKQKTAMVEGDMAKAAGAYNKELTVFSNAVTVANADLEKSQAALKTSQEEVAKRDVRISDLEAQNQTLDQRAAELASQITNLDSQIDDTKRQLASSKGENTFLSKELKRLMADKAELEKQFNDINVVRAQLAALREKNAIARRLDWQRRGIYAQSEKKEGEKLMQKTPPSTATTAAQAPTYDLNVEVNSDGSIKVIPALTNAPASVTPALAQ
jgi:chromosome segregation ATPase